MTEPEMAVMWLQAKECQGLLATSRIWERQARILPSSLQRERSPFHP
jgi:hypothetical protein